MQQKLKIGEILVRTGMIEQSQLDSALGEQTRWGGRIGVTLVNMGFLTEDDLMRALGSHFGLPVVRLEGKKIASEVLSLLPADFAEKHSCLPLFVHWESGQEVLYLGNEDPGDLAVLDDVSFRTGLRVKPVLVGPIQLGKAIQSFYHGASEEDQDLPQVRPVPGKTPLGSAPRPAPQAAPPAAKPQVAPSVAAAPPPAATPAPAAPSPSPAGPVVAAPEESAAPLDHVTSPRSFPSSPGYDPSYEQTFDALTGTAVDVSASEVEAEELADPGASLGLGAESPMDPVLDPGASADAVLAAVGDDAGFVSDASVLGAADESADPLISGTLIEEGDTSVDPNEDTHSSSFQDDPGKPRQVPTRDILRAVTQLMVEAGIFTREQLVEKLRATRTDRRGFDES